MGDWVLKGRFSDGLGKLPSEVLLSYILERAPSADQLQMFLTLGVDYTLQTVDILPVVPLYAEEKGMKVRLPTCCLAAANHVQQVMRSMLDLHLLNDTRTAESAGSDVHIDLSKHKGPWYSQDLSYATDGHPFWLTSTVYEELINLHEKELGKYRSYLPLLFGEKKLVFKGKVPPPPDLDFGKFLTFLKVYDPGNSLKDLESSTLGESYVLTDVLAFKDSYRSWLLSLNSTEGPITTIGQMMGDPTSFPVMPLCSLFSAQKVGIEVMRLMGDDATLPYATKDKIVVYESTQKSLGGHISKKKTFTHPKYGIFCEQILADGMMIHTDLLSFWVAPPGGSKGSMNWFTMPAAYLSSIANLPRDPHYDGLWEFSPFFNVWKAAEQLGLPMGSPEFMGGLCHPRLKREPHRRHLAKWVNTLSSMTKGELLTSSLNPIPSPGGSLLSGLKKDWINLAISPSAPPLVVNDHRGVPTNIRLPTEPILTTTYQFGVPWLEVTSIMKPLKHIAEAASLALNRQQIIEVYKSPLADIQHAPSLLMIYGKFCRKISKGRGDLPSYYNGARALQNDLEEKMELYVKTTNSAYFPSGASDRPYGVGPPGHSPEILKPPKLNSLWLA